MFLLNNRVGIWSIDRSLSSTMNEEEVSNRILAGYEDIALRLSTSEGIAEGLLK